MIVPGSNLLNMALNLIASQTVLFYKDVGRTTTADGEFITQLAPPVRITRCSVQAVDRTKYADAGLDMSKSYWTWFVSRNVRGVERGVSGDIVEWDGRRMQITADRPWFSLDGWDASVMVDIGPATGALTSPDRDERPVEPGAW